MHAIINQLSQQAAPRLVVCASLIFCLAAVVPTSGSAESRGEKRAYTVDQNFDITHGPNSIKVGKKGKAQQEYSVTRKHAGNMHQVTLLRKGQGSKGHELDFTYHEDLDKIETSAGGQMLRIDIDRKGSNVNFGSTQCNMGNTSCMAKAVMETLQHVTSEDVAAVESAMRDQLANTKDGSGIRDALDHLADELQKKGK